jgi:hypothetical protein
MMHLSRYNRYMRTTLAIDDQLLATAKKRARERGQTLGEYVEDSLRRSLVSAAPANEGPSIPMFTRGTGMRPGIDPTSNRALFDALDASGDLS